jgi:hypothetical protein
MRRLEAPHSGVCVCRTLCLFVWGGEEICFIQRGSRVNSAKGRRRRGKDDGRRERGL